jgi:hypothetical protein
MTAPRPRRARQDDEQPKRRLAIHDPAALAWGARMIQAGLERRRRRLAAEAQQDGNGHDDPR